MMKYSIDFVWCQMGLIYIIIHQKPDKTRGLRQNTRVPLCNFSGLLVILYFGIMCSYYLDCINIEKSG